MPDNDHPAVRSELQGRQVEICSVFGDLCVF